MGTQRSLLDLFKPGTPCVLDDGDGQVEVWVQKISPDQQDACLRRADAERARIMLALRDLQSEDRLSVTSDVLDFDRDSLVNYLVADEAQRQRMSIEAEIELGENELGQLSEWGKDDYLQGLRTLWDDTLKERWTEDGEDLEAQRVLEEFRRFDREVEIAFERALEDLRAEYAQEPLDTLRDKVIEKYVERRATDAWLSEYTRARIYYATRRPENHKAIYFAEAGMSALADLSEEVLNALTAAYDSVTVDMTQGKDLPRTTGSSPSSESPEISGTPDSSSPDTSSASRT